jgi:hypothetical protein
VTVPSVVHASIVSPLVRQTCVISLWPDTHDDDEDEDGGDDDDFVEDAEPLPGVSFCTTWDVTDYKGDQITVAGSPGRS